MSSLGVGNSFTKSTIYWEPKCVILQDNLNKVAYTIIFHADVESAPTGFCDVLTDMATDIPYHLKTFDFKSNDSKNKNDFILSWNWTIRNTCNTLSDCTNMSLMSYCYHTAGYQAMTYRPSYMLSKI